LFLNLAARRRDQTGKAAAFAAWPQLLLEPAGQPAKETIMRLFALAGAFVVLAATAPIVTPADAAPFATRYCAQYKGGAENCGFYSFHQCLAALAGNGGMCQEAPYQGDIIRVRTPYGSYRIRN
jgi:hypothetical protein